jgi:hypothetical protein
MLCYCTGKEGISPGVIMPVYFPEVFIHAVPLYLSFEIFKDVDYVQSSVQSVVEDGLQLLLVAPDLKQGRMENQCEPAMAIGAKMREAVY